jgi:prepilin-type processing-associated H-X9-DG protein
MRNLALATDSFQNTRQFYPGYVNTVGLNTNASWVVALLGNLERQDLYQVWAGSATAPTTSPYFELMVCPSDPPEQVGGAVLSYVANSGSGESGATNLIKNGIFHAAGTQSTVDTIPDGRSNTLLFSENIQATTWNISTRNVTTFMWWNTDTPADRKINGNKAAATGDNAARPSSYHSGGVNVAFADTHVGFLKQDVAYPVYRQLMTPNHKESDAPDKATHILDEKDFK